MTYRQTKRAEAARRAKHGVATRRRNIAAGPEPDYPADLPNLRRTVIVIDRDHGLRVTRLDLWRTSRVDSYLVHVDGMPWRRMGWSKLLEKLRLAHVRVASPRCN
jgi:hypothetical protein